MLSSTFITIFQKSTGSLLGLNIFLLIVLGIDFCIKFCLTKVKKYPYRLTIFKLFIVYVCKTYLGIEFIVLFLFYTSFMVPFPIARWLRLVFLFRFVDIVRYNVEVYRRLELYPVAKKLYTILKIMYLMMIFSHYFGCWFQLIDQIAINEQIFGPIANQNLRIIYLYLVYYQLNITCFTPIE